MRRGVRGRRGSILILVLAVLAMLGLLGAALSRAVYARSLSAQAWRKAEGEAVAARNRQAMDERLARGGKLLLHHETIHHGANDASSNEGVHGP